MSIDEFNKTGFTGGMKAKYKGGTHPIASCNFQEALFGLVDPNDEDELIWCRCENVEIVN